MPPTPPPHPPTPAPPVVYCCNGKAPFPWHWSGNGTSNSHSTSTSPDGGGGEPQVNWQVGGVPMATPSPGRLLHTPASAPDPLATGAVTARGFLPSPSNQLRGNSIINIRVIKTSETGFKAESWAGKLKCLWSEFFHKNTWRISLIRAFALINKVLFYLPSRLVGNHMLSRTSFALVTAGLPWQQPPS